VTMLDEATEASAVGSLLERGVMRPVECLRTVAALYVEPKGCYVGVPGVDAWDEARDARTYNGPHPVVAHPPCQRWGRFWHGSTRKPHQYKLGDDGGCFAAALAALRLNGGALEHPMDSHAWKYFRLKKPPRKGGWVEAAPGLWTCCVYQGHYGHLAGKGTWLLVAGVPKRLLPELRWGKTPQRLHPRAVELHGYEKARRIGMMAMVGGKDKTAIRNGTPPEFRDLLIEIARSAVNPVEQGAAALALLKRIRYHAQRHALPRDWLTAADEVLGTWHAVKLTHSEIGA
jgi:hypothetical protein